MSTARAPEVWPPEGGVDAVEIEVEDVAARSWLRRIAMTFGSQYGTQSYRFVARAPGEEQPTEGRTSGTFPVLPFALPSDELRGKGAWDAETEAALAELQQFLLDDGWVPAGQGEHWWSARYTRSRGVTSAKKRSISADASGPDGSV